MQYQWLIVLVRGLVIYYCKLAYRRAEDLLIKSVRGEDASSELDSVVSFYGDDLDRCRLELQLQSLAAQVTEDPDRPRLLLHDIVNYLACSAQKSPELPLRAPNLKNFSGGGHPDPRLFFSI